MTGQSAAPRRRFDLRLTLIGVLAVVAIIVVLQNTEPIETVILFTTFALPRALMLAIMLALGFGAGYLLCHRRAGRLRSPPQ